MDREKFEKLVWQGIEAIPKRFLEKLDNVDIVIEEEPTEEQKKKTKLGPNAKLFGLYEGIPQTKRRFYSGVLPDKITIFKKTFEEVCSSEEEIKKRVGQTVWHEIAHHFGMDEERVGRMEKRKKM
ncbi:MAG: metallopeptidase family protein [Patescibacteria group bacterium]